MSATVLVGACRELLPSHLTESPDNLVAVSHPASEHTKQLVDDGHVAQALAEHLAVRAPVAHQARIRNARGQIVRVTELLLLGVGPAVDRPAVVSQNDTDRGLRFDGVAGKALRTYGACRTGILGVGVSLAGPRDGGCPCLEAGGLVG